MRGGLFGPLWCARVPPPSAFGGAQYEPCSQTSFRPSTSRPAPDGRNRIQQFHFSSESKGVIRMWPLGATHAAKYCDKRLKSPGISSRTALPHSRSTSTLRRGNALSCMGRGHYLQLSGGRDGQPRCWRGHAGDPDPFDRTLSEGCWVGPMRPHRTTRVVLLWSEDEVAGVDGWAVDSAEADGAASGDGDDRVRSGGVGHVGRKGGRGDPQRTEVALVLTSGWCCIEVRNGVGTEACGEHEGVETDAASQGVVAGTTVDGVDSRATVEGVGAGPTDDPVVAA